MLVPRLGALILLIGLGFALAQVLTLAYPVVAEGYSSWLPAFAVILPAGALAALAAALVLRRSPIGPRLVLPLIVLTLATAALTFAGAPPIGRFLDDYERATLARGVEVPEYRRDQGWTKERYVEQRTSDVRSQGVLGAIAAVGVFAVLVRAGRPRRRQPDAASPA